MQKLAEICVRRPVFATMLILALTVIGAFAFFSLGVDRFPNIDIPVVSISTLNPGASPEEIEREVTDIIEGSVNTVAGIDDLRSISVEGLSTVIVQFNLEKDVDIATQEVRQKVDLVLRDLPETADPPIVQKLDPDAAPILMYAVSSKRPTVELTELIDDNVVERIESVSGVGDVTLYGGRPREIQIFVNPERLRAYSLTVADVANAVRAQNMELPGGNIDEGATKLSVRTLGRLQRAEDFEELVIRNVGGYAVKVRDIGRIEDRGAEAETAGGLNGRPAVVLAIRKQSGTNTVAVADAAKARMAELEATLPRDLSIRLMRDQSEFIRAALHSIEEHLILGGLFASIVVFVFLWNFRSTIIAAIAIPTSIISAFGLMAALGYTLNQMTMLALTLMVGIVIDDAIVVLENIYRFLEEKNLSPFEAAIQGTREIGLAVMATTLSLLAVFVPIGFMGGIVGRFMSSFGLTSAAAIAVSLLVSFTLTPMLSSRWLKKEDVAKDPTHEDDSADLHPEAHTAHASSKESRFYRKIDQFYTRMLHWSMAHRWTIVAVSVVVTLSTVPLFKLAGVNFLPEEDENQFEVQVRAPEGTSLAAMGSILERMARDIRENVPGVENTLTVAGFGAQRSANNGTVFVRLTQVGDREEHQYDLMDRAREIVKKYPPEIVSSVQPVAAFGGGAGRNTAIQYILAGPDLKKLDEYSAKLLEHMKKEPNIVDADRSLIPGKPEVRVNIDRKRAADLGVRVSDIALTLNTLFAGSDVSTFTQGKNQYDVVVRAQQEFRREPEEILSMTVPSGSGVPVELRNVVKIVRGTGPGTIDRLNRQRQVTMFANVAPGGSQSEALASMQAFVAGMNMDPGYSPVLTGQSKELQRAGFYFMLAFRFGWAPWDCWAPKLLALPCNRGHSAVRPR